MKVRDAWNYKVFWRPVRVGITALGGFCVVAGCYAVIQRDPNEWPSWIQAIGSLVALGIAIWLPWLESKRRRHEDLAKDRAHARRLFYAAYEIWGQVAGLFNELQLIRNYDREVAMAVFERILNRLNSSFDDDPHPERVVLVHDLRQNLPGLLGYLKNGASDENAGGARIFKLKGYYEDVCKDCWKHLADVEKDLSDAEKTVRPKDF